MPNELTPHRPNSPEFLPPADEYARIVDLATRLAGTAFVPNALRGDNGEPNPPAVLAAMLTGREEGLEPMESLRSVHMIEGRPTLSADAQMKLAMRAGHLLIVTETTRERATVKYRHADWPDDEGPREITFDLEDADLAGLKGRAMWNKYPRAMLRSRAITEACRAGGLLSSAGIAYTAEEITDDDDHVEEAVIVESISVDDEDVDELDRRRELHRRAAAAHRAIDNADPDLAAQAWAQASQGLGRNAWVEADLDVLSIRVADLERIAADLPDEDDDGGEGDAGPEPGDDDDGPDGDTDGPDDAPAPESATESDDDGQPVEVDGTEPTSAAEAEAEEVDPAVETEAAVAADVLPVDEEGDGPPGGMTVVERLEAFYPELTVAHVSALLRTGSIEFDTVDGQTVTVELPRSAPGGVLAAYELVEALEAAEHGTDDAPEGRKTVKGALENAGWTPKGRERLAAARRRDAMDDPDPRHADEDAHDDAPPAPADDAQDGGPVAPEEAPAPETATESDPEPVDPDSLDDSMATRRRLLARHKRTLRAIGEISKPRARRAEVQRLNAGLGEDDAWLGADVADLGRIVADAERILAAARRDAANPAIGDAR